MSFLARDVLADKRVVLASQSPRRRELTKMLTDSFEVIPSDCDENVPDGMAAAKIPEYLAERKCRDVVRSCKADDRTIVIGCDTVVISGGKALGKPADEADALAMLTELSGREHSVVSGLCVYYRGAFRTASVAADVRFRRCTEAELRAYIATGEPMDKAGSYGIQGLGGLLVDHICGDYYTIVGLPVARLAEMLYDILGGEVTE